MMSWFLLRSQGSLVVDFFFTILETLHEGDEEELLQDVTDLIAQMLSDSATNPNGVLGRMWDVQAIFVDLCKY